MLANRNANVVGLMVSRQKEILLATQASLEMKHKGEGLVFKLKGSDIDYTLSITPRFASKSELERLRSLVKGLDEGLLVDVTSRQVWVRVPHTYKHKPILRSRPLEAVNGGIATRAGVEYVSELDELKEFLAMAGIKRNVRHGYYSIVVNATGSVASVRFKFTNVIIEARKLFVTHGLSKFLVYTESIKTIRVILRNFQNPLAGYYKKVTS